MEPTCGHSVQVLVVENHDEVRQLIANVVTEQGWHPVEAVGIAQALQHLQATRIDAIISDWELDDGEGRSLLEAAGHIPAVMVSSYASPALREEARSAGAIELLEKPFRIERLIDLLDRELRQAALTP